MQIDEIKALIEAMGSSDLAEMEFCREGWTLKLRRNASSSLIGETESTAPTTPARATTQVTRAVATPKSPTPVSRDIIAPLSGVAHLAPAPDAAPFVTAGQSVEAGAIICTIEAMKTFNEIRAERAGVIEAILIKSGDDVEAGQSLMRLA